MKEFRLTGDASDITRRSDPETSYEAAERVLPKLSRVKTLVYEFILSAGSKGTTIWDVEEHFGDHIRSTYRTRVAELCGIGAHGMRVWPPLVKKTGEKRMRAGTNREVVVAIACMKGRV